MCVFLSQSHPSRSMLYARLVLLTASTVPSLLSLRAVFRLLRPSRSLSRANHTPPRLYSFLLLCSTNTLVVSTKRYIRAQPLLAPRDSSPWTILPAMATVATVATPGALLQKPNKQCLYVFLFTRDTFLWSIRGVLGCTKSSAVCIPSAPALNSEHLVSHGW